MTQAYEAYENEYFDAVANEGYGLKRHPLANSHGKGAFLVDDSGRRYIDLGLAAGCAFLGHAHPVVTEAIERQARRGTVFAIPSDLTHQYGQLLREVMPWHKSFVFCNSGSEATMRAIRIARAATGRSKIAMFSGGWHGSHDMVLMDEKPGSSESNPLARLKSPGTPDWMHEQMLFLPYNHDAAFEQIEAHADELAIVLIEPSQGSNPRGDVGPFLKKLRDLTRANGIVLCFDEVITGGRMSLGGAQEYYGIEADLATYGKTLGGGLPIGIIGGSEHLMRCVRGQEGPHMRPLFMGGTFSGNPLSMAAGNAALQFLVDSGASLYERINRDAQTMRDRINRLCQLQGLKVRAIGVTSMSRLIFTDKPIRSRHQRDQLEWSFDKQCLFFDALFERGVYVGSNRTIFTSTEHTSEIISEATEAILATLSDFHTRGYF